MENKMNNAAQTNGKNIDQAKARLAQRIVLAKSLRKMSKAELLARLSRSVRIHSANTEPKDSIIYAIVDAELSLSKKAAELLGL